MRKPVILVGFAAPVLAAVPVVVLAAGGQNSSRVDRQLARWTTTLGWR